MQKKDAAALDAIMKHKEYFDQRLIDMVTDLNRTIKSINKDKTSAIYHNNQLVITNKSLNIKVNDLRSENSILRIQFAKEKAEKDDLLKEVLRI